MIMDSVMTVSSATGLRPVIRVQEIVRGHPRVQMIMIPAPMTVMRI
jgi:hypothetical protein